MLTALMGAAACCGLLAAPRVDGRTDVAAAVAVAAVAAVAVAAVAVAAVAVAAVAVVVADVASLAADVIPACCLA